jgi:putative ABC transport system permease protein
MRIWSTIRTALRALRRNQMRSLLTALGIIIGVAAVIAMVSVGNGAKALVEGQIASMGQNVLLVLSGNVTRSGMSSGFGGAGTLTVADGEAIQREVTGITRLSPEVRRSFRVAAGSKNWFTQIGGVSPEFFEIRSWDFTSGTAFTERDVNQAGKVAIIGATVARELFGSEDPVGQIIRIKNVPFKVYGVLTPKGSSVMGNDQDDVIYMPYTSAMKRLIGTSNIRMLHVQLDPTFPATEVKDHVTQILLERHRIGPDKEQDFMLRSQDDISQAATATSRIMTALLATIASISLLVGGIGIMNIMLVSVTERTREIGIRLAIGAHGRDILLQFLVEAIVLSSLGGALGIALGIGSAHLVTRFTGWITLVSPLSVILAFSVSTIIGIFFGFYPARRAASLDPIEALRYE